MTNRPTFAQLETLVEFLEQNPGIAKGLLRTAQAKLETKRKWANLAVSLNALGGANKDGQGWAKYWAEKKCGLKKHCAQLTASMRRTGGGRGDDLPALSALDSRLVAVMGGLEFATGDSGLAVDPFPESIRPQDSPDNIVAIPTQEDEEMQGIRLLSPVPSTSQHRLLSPVPSTSQQDVIHTSAPIPAPTTQSNLPQRRRRRSSNSRHVDVSMERLARIEERRVEAELTTAQAFAQMSEQIGNIATAITSIANAILEISRKMPN